MPRTAPRTAIMKPDHLGDLVLSAPAIRALRARGAVTLYVASGSMPLARFLFPDIDDLRQCDLKHLSRRPIEFTPLDALARELAGYDAIIVLRDDAVMREIVADLGDRAVVAAGDLMTHETLIQQRAVAPLTGDYSRTRLFSRLPIAWPASLRRVALCIAAGFITNRWPLGRWRELGVALQRSGIELSLLGGPAEHDDLRFLARLLRCPADRIIEGGDDIGGFLASLDPIDLVIATDGGSAHIASLAKPVLSLFGSSPWRRYAPFGAQNMLLTRDEPCSPCAQFSTNVVNACLTRECLAAMLPAQVLAVLRGAAPRGVTAVRGTSHLDDSGSRPAP
jgi:heptosyltransferase-2